MDGVAAGELERSHLAEIHRRWPRYGWGYLGRSRWTWSAEPFLGLGITGALIATLYFEITLFTGKAEPWFAALNDLGFDPTGQAAILLLTGINAWTMDRWLASHTRGNRSMSVWLRLLRPLTAGVPVLGLASVPAWRWITASRPAWAFCHAGARESVLGAPAVPGPSLAPRRLAGAEIWLRTLSQRLPALVVWLIGCLLAPFLGGLSWLAGEGRPLDVGTLLWLLFWIGLTAVSWFLMFEPATPLAGALETALVLAPLWSLGSFLVLGRWLLRPFTFRHLADSRLPRSDRAILAGVALTAALPLGGLAIPFWIYAHHRLWPGMERSWAATRS